MQIIKDQISKIIEANGEQIIVDGIKINIIKHINGDLLAITHEDKYEKIFAENKELILNNKKHRVKKYTHDGIVGRVLIK